MMNHSQQPLSSYLNYNNNVASVRDEYKTPQDRIWGDVIKHERVLELIWKDTWEKTIVPKELRPENYMKPTIKKNKDVTFYCPGPSSKVPLKASAMIGWRSSDKNKSMEYFNVKYISDKKRFVKEQFGHYRALKYLAEDEKKVEADETTARDEKYIKHTIKRLVC